MLPQPFAKKYLHRELEGLQALKFNFTDWIVMVLKTVGLMELSGIDGSFHRDGFIRGCHDS